MQKCLINPVISFIRLEKEVSRVLVYPVCICIVLMSSVEIRSSALRESNDFVVQMWRLLFVLVQSSLYLA